MPDQPTPFDSLLQADTPASGAGGAVRYAALLREVADKLVADDAAPGDVKLLATPCVNCGTACASSKTTAARAR